VFGGNGFLGASTVERLVKDGYTLTTASRGNWYWDSEQRVLPHVNHITCNRKHGLDNCSDLIDVIERVESFDAVLDFSSYGPDEMKDSVKALKNKVGIYLFISGSSVYDVSLKRHEGPTRENDAVRPPKEEQEDVNKHHPHGHAKLSAEEVLMNQRLDGGFPFVILRLPDVVGPRDTTTRWWMYHLWVKLSAHIPDHPVTVPGFLTEYPITFVYSEDVASAIIKIIHLGPQIEDQAINLAYPETFTMDQVLEDMRMEMRIEGAQFNITDDQMPFYVYPTYRRGPLDIERAVSLINWSPTPWKEAVREMVEFYEAAMSNETFERERNHVVNILGHQVYSDVRMTLYETLEKLYNIDLSYFTHKDEL